MDWKKQLSSSAEGYDDETDPFTGPTCSYISILKVNCGLLLVLIRMRSTVRKIDLRPCLQGILRYLYQSRGLKIWKRNMT